MRLPASEATAWVDGRRSKLGDARVAVEDPGFLAGLGLFETLAVRDGRALELEAHLARLVAGAERLAVPLPGPAEVRRVTECAAAEQPARCAWLKIVATRSRWFVFGGEQDPEVESRPASAVLLPWTRNPGDPLAGLKTLNYAPNLLGLERARSQGADEGLWLNTRGHLAEGCASNVFVIDGGRLFTPSVRDGILAGVVRDLVLRAARGIGLPVHEGKLRLHRLETADEAFLTSSLRGVRPLVRFAGRPVGRGEPGSWTGAIAREVHRLRAGAGRGGNVE